MSNVHFQFVRCLPLLVIPDRIIRSHVVETLAIVCREQRISVLFADNLSGDLVEEKGLET